jgi:hypothetical protein
MRLWSLHPGYLDAQGLVALWREGLLAQKVLRGETRGYRDHPQLLRFKRSRNPLGAIASYLRCVADEAATRGYRFDRSKIARRGIRTPLPVTTGQVQYEYQHLLAKTRRRSPDVFHRLKALRRIAIHPLFKKVRGGVEPWERR